MKINKLIIVWGVLLVLSCLLFSYCIYAEEFSGYEQRQPNPSPPSGQNQSPPPTVTYTHNTPLPVNHTYTGNDGNRYQVQSSKPETVTKQSCNLQTRSCGTQQVPTGNYVITVTLIQDAQTPAGSSGQEIGPNPRTFPTQSQSSVQTTNLFGVAEIYRNNPEPTVAATSIQDADRRLDAARYDPGYNLGDTPNAIAVRSYRQTVDLNREYGGGPSAYFLPDYNLMVYRDASTGQWYVGKPGEAAIPTEGTVLLAGGQNVNVQAGYGSLDNLKWTEGAWRTSFSQLAGGTGLTFTTATLTPRAQEAIGNITGAALNVYERVINSLTNPLTKPIDRIIRSDQQ